MIAQIRLQSLANADCALEVVSAHAADVEERACKRGDAQVVNDGDFVLAGDATVHANAGSNAAMALRAQHDIDGIHRLLLGKHLPQSRRAPVANDTAVAGKQRCPLTGTWRGHRPELINTSVHATQQSALQPSVDKVARQSCVKQLPACQ